MLIRLAACVVGIAALAPAGAYAQLSDDQASFDLLVNSAGATNGGAENCGGAAPDIAQHRAVVTKNLKQFAQEFGYKLDRYDATFAAGQEEGREMMIEMRRTGVDGCTGVLQGLQTERSASYEDFKATVAEVADGLPEK